MNENLFSKIEELKKALEAGGYNAAPGALTQGSALQMEDLSDLMNVTTFQDSQIQLQKELKVVPARSTLVQFNRQLDYGIFGGSAVLEGAVGQEETSSYARIVVPMSYYVHVRRYTIQANMIQAFDGVKAEDRVEADSAMKMAGDIEFHLFRGRADYSNAGVFDGNYLAMSSSDPALTGLDPQIRQSDFEANAQDLMFNEFGSNISVVLPVNAILAQSNVEDILSVSAMHNGHADTLYLDPRAAAAYNKLNFALNRIVLSGSPQKASGAELNEQFTAGGPVKIKTNRFLSTKTQVARPRVGAPAAPTQAAATQAANTTSFNVAEVYTYQVSSANEIGESALSASQAVTIAATGNSVSIVITPTAGAIVRWFNIYRSLAGSTAVSFIGRVAYSGAGTATFVDLNNRLPFSITGFGIDMRGMEIAEMSPYKSVELAMTDLSKPKAFFRFLCLVAKLPRFSILLDNIKY